MIKKRKIRVPAASFGIGGGSNWSQMLQSPQTQNMQYIQSVLNNTYQNPNQQYLQQIGSTSNTLQQMQEQAYYNNAQNRFKLDMLNKDPRGATKFNQAMNNSPAAQQINAMTSQQQTDAYSSKSGGGGGGFSNMQVGDLAAATTGGIASIAGYGPKSEATNRDEAVTQSLADVSKGISTGAAMGSAFGPMGTMIGAGVGLGIGLIGRKGREAEMTSFTDYDEGTLGTGLIGAFSNKKLRRERERIKQNAWKNRAAVQGTGNLQAEYNLEHGNMSTNTFAYGGLTNNLAYVDDGELISTPDGNIVKVPEQGNPTDSNLVSLPEGSRILSDKLKVPGTNKTFAQVGEEMMSTKKSKFNDRYAENAAKLNEMNNKSIHDQLFEMQEALKAKKGIKRKYKNAVIAAEGGDEVKKRYTYSNYTPIDKKWYLQDDDAAVEYMTKRQWVLDNPRHPLAIQLLADINSGKYGNISKNRFNWKDFAELSIDGKRGPVHNGILALSIPEVNAKGKEMPDLTMAGLNIPTAPGKPSRSALASSIDLGSYPTPDVRQPVRPRQPEERPDNTGILSDIASSIAGLAPIISNLNTSPEYQRAIHNPYANAVMTTMRNRRYDISPVIRDIERNRAVNNYNASQVNTNTGANMAFRLQSAQNTARAIADVRSQESNINNQYLADYASTLDNLGRQWANEEIRVQEANMANRAQARNIRRAGLSGLSQWAQNRELMRNQRERDNALLALYDPFIESVTPNADYASWRRYLRRGGNR